MKCPRCQRENSAEAKFCGVRHPGGLRTRSNWRSPALGDGKVLPECARSVDAGPRGPSDGPTEGTHESWDRGEHPVGASSCGGGLCFRPSPLRAWGSRASWPPDRRPPTRRGHRSTCYSGRTSPRRPAWRFVRQGTEWGNRTKVTVKIEQIPINDLRHGPRRPLRASKVRHPAVHSQLAEPVRRCAGRRDGPLHRA